MKKYELNEFKALDLSGYAIADTRKPEIFVNGFIEDSVSIPFDDSFTDTLQELISADLKVMIVADEADVAAIVKTVKSSGLNNIAGYLAGGF